MINRALLMLVNEWGWDSRKSDKPANDCRRDSDFSKEQSAQECQAETQLGTPDDAETIVEAESAKGEIDCDDEEKTSTSREGAGVSRVYFPIHA